MKTLQQKQRKEDGCRSSCVRCGKILNVNPADKNTEITATSTVFFRDYDLEMDES